MKEWGDDSWFSSDEPIPLDIDGTLDLHAFSPKDLRHLIPDYLSECQQVGIFEVRIIHGKGIGNLRRTVHSLLEKSPLVQDYQLAPPEQGSWGATMVTLKRPS